MKLKMTDTKNTAIGWSRHAKSFADAANDLLIFRENEGDPYFHDPAVDFLCAHSLELALKGIICLTHQEAVDLKDDFGHHLLKAWDAAKATERGQTILECCQKSVNNFWKTKLRQLNDEWKQELTDYGVADQDGFDVRTNYEIGEELPKLRDTVEWFNDLHNNTDNPLRYPKTTMIQRPIFTLAGKRLDILAPTALQSTFAICRSIDSQVRNHPK